MSGLQVLSNIYRQLLSLRAWLYQQGWIATYSPPVPTISVGNIIVGGTGKTPLVLWLTQQLLQYGRKPAIISRGYGRRSSGTIVVSDGTHPLVSVEVAGDEPFWYALNTPVPVIVDAQRHRAIQVAHQSFPIDTVILDDAFQHWKLCRHCDIVIVDQRTVQQRHLLPAGLLREPKTALHRADLVLAYAPLECTALRHDIADSSPCFTIRPFVHPPKHWLGPVLPFQPCIAFAGIANPDRFFNDLQTLGIQPRSKRHFPDHHWYRPRDIQSLVALAQQHQCSALITTEKDGVRLLPYQPIFQQFNLAVYVIPFQILFQRESEEKQCLQQILQCLDHPAKSPLAVRRPKKPNHT